MESVDSSKSDIARLLSFADPRIAVFLDAWRHARQGALVPCKRNFEPLLIPSLLRFVWLYQYEPGLGDFVCRLAGEEINTAWGGSIRNATLKQVVGPEDHPTLLKRWMQIIERPVAIHGARDERFLAHQHWRAERLMLPLNSDDGRKNHVIGISLYKLAQPEGLRDPMVSEDITIIPCEDL